MQIHLKQLNATLRKSLAPIYFLSGDEPLLLQEARDSIRQAAQNAGFLTTERLLIEPQFDWNRFSALTQNLSLFSDKMVIDLRTPNPKFDEQGAARIAEYCAQPTDSIILILSTAKLTSAQQKSKWFTAVTQQAVHVPIWPLDQRALHDRIHTTLQQASMTASDQSIAHLIEMTEGNLLAMQQALEKLKLLFPGEQINVDKMAQALSDSARFTVFDLTQATLLGNTKQLTRILQQLQHAGAELPLVLWALCKEIRELIHCHFALQSGQSLHSVLAKQWASRKTLLQSALHRTTYAQLSQALQFAASVDQVIKGQRPGNPWEAIAQLALMVCHTSKRVQHARA